MDPLNPGQLYTLRWAAHFACHTIPDDAALRPVGWRTDYVTNPSHPNGEPAFRMACYPEPVHADVRSARFQLNKADPNHPESGSKRAEVKTFCCEPLNAERWYRIGIYLPPDHSFDRSGEILAQWHQYDWPPPPNKADLCVPGKDPNAKFCGPPPLSIMTEAGEWKIAIRFPSWDNLVTTEARRIWQESYGGDLGSWTYWTVHAKWSTDTTEGLLEVWKNGRKLTLGEDGNKPFRGQTKFGDGKGHYMKIGIYKWAWASNGNSTTEQRVVYHDNVRISDTTTPPPSGMALFDPPEIHAGVGTTQTYRVGLKEYFPLEGYNDAVAGKVHIANPTGEKGTFDTNTDFRFRFRSLLVEGEWIYPDISVEAPGYLHFVPTAQPFTFL